MSIVVGVVLSSSELSPMKISILCGECAASVIVFSKDTVGQIKDSFFKECGVNHDHCINLRLDDNKTLEDYNISPSSHLSISRQGESFSVLVKLPFEKVLSLTVKEFMTFEDLKGAVSESEKYPLDFFKLVFESGFSPLPFATLGKSGLASDSIVCLKWVLEIYVKLPNQKIIVIGADAGASIALVRREVAEKLGFPADRIHFIHEGVLLEDTYTLDYYNIARYDVLYLALSIEV
jgi:hypothetical protein